ncbi:MAG: competence protein CelA [Clostridia bacterium]|jgi:competence protein ComEA|nr:competence protein CelA [Clostridia bacterium]
MIYNLMKYKKTAVLILIIIIIICGIVYRNTVYPTQVVMVTEVEQQVALEKPDEPEIENTNITVYVCGSVREPINVTLPKDSRVEDAIKLAGGVNEQADLNGINMAQKLQDEDMVYVPKKGEIIEVEDKNSNVRTTPIKKGKININKAALEELDTLPGIGPSIAQKVIDYRESSGGFRSIEELNNVSGIGEEKYKDIKSLITVD